MLLRMQRYFESLEAIEQFLEGLREFVCPFCGSVGTMVRHGYIWGAISRTEYGIRAWRVFCDPDSPRGRGCKRGPSVRLSTGVLRRCFSTVELGKFISALRRGQSVYAAWKHSGIGLSMRTAYRLYRRLGLCQSVWRTHLHSRAPPPKKEGVGSPLLQVFEHLQEAFGEPCAVTAYQESLQRDFLAVA